jgi:hypothetical protein
MLRSAVSVTADQPEEDSESMSWRIVLLDMNGFSRRMGIHYSSGGSEIPAGFIAVAYPQGAFMPLSKLPAIVSACFHDLSLTFAAIRNVRF